MAVAAATRTPGTGGVVLEFRVLGALEVWRDGQPVAVASGRHRALLTRLLLARDQVVPAADLIDATWADAPPARAQHALHAHISRLRGLLGAADVLTTSPPGYRLAVPPEAVDAERFEAVLHRAREQLGGDPPGVAARLAEALGWWRGPAYLEFAADFAQPAAVRLAELRRVARQVRGEALLAAGAVERACGELAELAAEEPLREAPHALLMRALAGAGRQAEALVVYQEFRQRIADQLGLDPSPQLRKVHQQVLRGQLPAGPSHAAGPSTAVGSSTAAGPIRSAQPARPTLPPPAMTSFVGRAREAAELALLLGRRRIVTVAGPGGVGKTRLAYEVASRPGDRPTWWVDLTPARDAADLAYRFTQALSLPEPVDAGIEDFLVDTLRDQQGLLVADNCEQVIAAAAALLHRIAVACPGVVVLATSREPLAVPGEHVLVLAPFPQPEPATGAAVWDSPAVALFADRYRASGGPELSTHDLELAVEICRRVDRLPLAIELAAARARSLGLPVVAERPTLDLLTGARRIGQARHRSVRAVLDWSHELLDRHERVLLRRLAVFTSAFSLADAEAVCADGLLAVGRIPDSLAGLVEKSMVVGPAPEQYRLLGTVSAYAREHLAAHGEQDWVGAAHARHLVRVAEQAARQFRTADEPAAVARLTRRQDELRGAHRWACAHDPDLAVRLVAALAQYARYHLRVEIQDWVQSVARMPAAAGHPLLPTVLGTAAATAWERGDFTQAQRLARQGLAAAPPGDPLAALPTLVLGDVALLEGRFTEAGRAYAEAAALCRDDPHLWCEALGGVAIAASYRGDADAARQAAEVCLRAGRDAGPPGATALSLYFTGESWLGTDPERALALLEESRRIAGEIDALFVLGLATLSAVSIRARAAADAADALAAYEEAIAHWRRVGNRTQQWVTLRNLIPILVRAGHDEVACLVHAALATTAVRLPPDLPEADALAAALATARQRLDPSVLRATEQRAARSTLEEILTVVLAAIRADQAGSSR